MAVVLQLEYYVDHSITFLLIVLFLTTSTINSDSVVVILCNPGIEQVCKKFSAGGHASDLFRIGILQAGTYCIEEDLEA
jgi:hypothetical protein